MSNTPSLSDTKQFLSPELSAMEILGNSFHRAFIFIAITLAGAIGLQGINTICLSYSQKSLAETSTFLYLMFLFGGLIYFVYAAIVLILFFIHIWNTPSSIVRGGRIGKVFVGLFILGIILCFVADLIPIEFSPIIDFFSDIFVLIVMIVFLLYLNRVASAIGSSRVKILISWIICSAIFNNTLFNESVPLFNYSVIAKIELFVAIIMGLVTIFSFLFSFYFLSSDISTFIGNQRRQNDNCQPDNQQ